MVFKHGSIENAREIAQIYIDAFPSSIQFFFGKKRPEKLIKLLTSAFSLLLAAGAKVMLACQKEGRVLGYCIYSTREKRPDTRIGLERIGNMVKFGITLVFNINILELFKLMINSILTVFSTRKTKKLPRRFGRINSIAVHPDAHGQGIGKQLLKRVLTELANEDVFLSVRPDNEPAKRLYLSSGFESCGTTRDLQGVWMLMIRTATN
ncbi:MAG: GNAT family N-acetyltransferase [Firmicutes bacterium]|nr:GNAT family N-acetyltransferase [Bacillota bacterium]